MKKYLIIYDGKVDSIFDENSKEGIEEYLNDVLNEENWDLEKLYIYRAENINYSVEFELLENETRL